MVLSGADVCAHTAGAYGLQCGDSPVSALATDLGHIDLTHFQLGDGSGKATARTDMGTDGASGGRVWIGVAYVLLLMACLGFRGDGVVGPPDEVLPNFLYLSGR